MAWYIGFRLECEKFNIQLETSESWIEAESLKTEFINLWTTFKEYDEGNIPNPNFLDSELKSFWYFLIPYSYCFRVSSSRGPRVGSMSEEVAFTWWLHNEVE